MDCCFKKEGEEYAGKECGGYRPKNGKTAGRKDWRENNGKEGRKEHRDGLLQAGKTDEAEKRWEAGLLEGTIPAGAGAVPDVE